MESRVRASTLISAKAFLTIMALVENSTAPKKAITRPARTEFFDGKFMRGEVKIYKKKQ